MLGPSCRGEKDEREPAVRGAREGIAPVAHGSTLLRMVGTLVSGCFCLRHARRRRSSRPAAVCIGAAPLSIAESFGSGFWSLIPFTMQMTFIIIGGYVIADSPPVAALVRRLAAIPRTGRGAVALVALFSATCVLDPLGLQPGVLRLAGARAGAARRFADGLSCGGAAACTGTGIGLGARPVLFRRAAAGEPGSMPSGASRRNGRHSLQPDHLLVAVDALRRRFSRSRAPGSPGRPRRAPGRRARRRSSAIDLQDRRDRSLRSRPGEWLEYSPVPALFIAVLGAAYLIARICGQRLRRGDLEPQHLQLSFHRGGLGAAMAAAALHRCGSAQRAGRGRRADSISRSSAPSPPS